MKVIISLISSLLYRILPQSITGLFVKPKKIVWLVHPRGPRDMVRKISLFKHLSDQTVMQISKRIWPFTISDFLDKNSGLEGYVIGIPLSAELMKKDPEMARKRTRQALELATRLGAETISLAGMLTSIVEQNNFKADYPLAYYDGTSMISQLIAQRVSEITSSHQTNIGELNLAVIGATTKVGASISKLLVQLQFKKVYLFGRTQSNLEKLQDECKALAKDAIIEVSTDLSLLSQSDISVLSAYINSDDAVEEYLKSGSIFISGVEPVSPFVYRLKDKRKDIKVQSSVTINTPGVNYAGYNFGLPKDNSFVCLTEALVNTTNGIPKEESTNLGDSVDELSEALNKHKFKPVWEERQIST